MGLSPIVLLLTLHNTMGVSEKETEPTRQWFPIYDDQNQLFQSPFGDYALEYWLAKAHFTIWFQLRRKQVESLEDLRNFSRRRLRILPSKVTSLNHEENDLEKGDEPQSIVIPIRRSTRTRRPTDRMCLYIDAEEHELGDLGEPANYKATLLDPESDKWLNAMNVEMQSMKDNEELLNGESAKQAFSLLLHSAESLSNIAAFDASKEAVWVRKFIYGLGVVPTIEKKPINCSCDNTGQSLILIILESLKVLDKVFRAKVITTFAKLLNLGDIKVRKSSHR
ncbi:hypothetical protein Tco_1530729 [Tanacetum coccineum]